MKLPWFMNRWPTMEDFVGALVIIFFFVAILIVGLGVIGGLMFLEGGLL